jgi:RimJ/RimL family protein N-acetyltransferase
MRRPTADVLHEVAEVARAEGTRDAAPARMASTIRRVSSAEKTDGMTLGDGTRLVLRPIDPNDRDGVAALFARLSPESRHRRFLASKHDLTRSELAYLTDIDHVQHEAIAAVDQCDGSIIGVSRYVQVPGRPGVAEIAGAVVDELHNMGVAAALARRTVERARANGFALLTATTLWDNLAARAVLRRLGFRRRSSHGSEIELELELYPQATRSSVAREAPWIPVATHHRMTIPVHATTSRKRSAAARTQGQT